ncbi:MAG: T9SS type A sorting domain-containing protein [bacterium]
MKNSIYTSLIVVLILLTCSQSFCGELSKVGGLSTYKKGTGQILNTESKRTEKQLVSADYWEQIPGPYGGIIISLASYQNILYAGTMGGSVYKSTDFGDNWIFIGENLPFLDVQKVLFYGGRLFVSNKEYGIYFTEDDGLNWTPLNNGLKNIQVTSMVELDGNLFCSTYGGGIFASTNKGDTWVEKNAGLNNKFVNQLTLYRGGLYLATNQGIFISGNYAESWGTFKSTGSYMYIAVNEQNIFIASNYQIWMTSNNGLVWDLADSYVLGYGIIYSLYSTGPYILAGRSAGVFVSTYNGGQWVNVHSELPMIRVYSLLNFNNFVYAGTSKGIFYSNDYGGRWNESNNGLLNERVLSILIDNNIMYAGLQDNGVIMSTDYGITWTDLNLGYRRVSYLFKDLNGLWVISNDSLLLTSNNGITWEYRNYGLEGNKIHFFKQYKNEFYAGTDDGLYFSTNLGLNWLVKTHFLRQKQIKDFYVDNNDDVYLATDDKIYLSRDNAVTWIPSSDGMKSYNITKITGNDSCLVAGSQPEPQFDAEIYVSYDGARTWISTDFKFEDQYIHDINISGKSVFVSVKNTGTDECTGVLYSSNSGKSWNEFNEGLTVKDVRDLAIHDNIIYAASYGQSLFKREIPEPLPMPVLLYPANDAKKIFTQPVLDWETIDGAETYNIEIGDSYNNFDKHIISDFSSTISQLQIPEKILDFQKTYYWRVNFVKNTRTSDWSEIFNFTTESEQPTITNLISPANNSSDVTVLTVFGWEQLDNVSEYILQVSESELFDTNVLEVSVIQNSYTAPKGKLDFNRKYYWRVRAIINGYERDWSEIFDFTTMTLNLVSPQLVYPLDNALDIPLSTFFEWEEVANADEYILNISEDSQFTVILLSDTLNTTILNVTEGILNWETDYYWRVKSKFLDYESEWSSARKFKTTYEVFVEDDLLISPINFELTPNPAQKLVNINLLLPFSGQLKIYLLNIIGSKLYEKVFDYDNAYSNATISVSLQNFSSGNYFVILETKYGVFFRSLNIKK